MSDVTIDELMQLNLPIPRYTSYPTAPEWGPFHSDDYKSRLTNISGPLSLYLHIPFCRTMCLYCACSVVLNRRQDVEENYVRYLCKEIELVAAHAGKQKVTQLHFGGGTPTQLQEAQLDTIFGTLNDCFAIDVDAEIAIEIDPRTVGDGKKLQFLRHLGFNRVSFGVQDTNQAVQEAVKRRQSYEMTRDTYLQARALGFTGINIDLIYGLPYQSVATFQDTADKIIQLRPDRIALFSYAQVPWLKPHQKAISPETLPSTQEKFAIYLLARKMFIEAGYIAIGMDHFALRDDELAVHFQQKSLQRNFQGYTTFSANHMLGFGMTAIGHVSNAYVQNKKELISYYAALDAGQFPVERGIVLSQDDLIRRYTIHRMMCDCEIDKRKFKEKFEIPFDHYFEQAPLHTVSDLTIDSEHLLQANEKGRLFIRNIAACFDAYLKPSHQQFSQSV